MNSFLEIPIEADCLPQTDNIKLEEIDESFVDIYTYSDKTIKVDMQYVKAGIDGAINVAYVRKSVAEKLLKAKSLLPMGYTFEILDAWRPYEVQFSLYNSYREEIIKNVPDNMPEEEIKKLVCEFVSFPDKSKKISYVHSCGGAVDLTIVDADGKRLNMGSDFDEFTDRSYTAWYEKEDADVEIRNNRRLLNNVLCHCGFTNYPAEWWHFDYGDAFWSFYTGKKAAYASKFELKEVKIDE